VTTERDAEGLRAPSRWVLRWLHLLPPRARVLDVACGRGRHVRVLAAAGHLVTGIDRDREALADLGDVSGVERLVLADLENGPWPVPGETFDAVLVTNYLWRPLWPALHAAVAPGGLWIHETFTRAHAALGRPRRPEFLLEPGELLAVAATAFQVIAYQAGRLGSSEDGGEREIQRIVARRARDGAATPDAIDWLSTPGTPG
jgi:SAM-dependent methyltransferase